MLSNVFSSVAFALVVVLLTSCRQPLDLDVDNRLVTPTNLPEIISFTPQAAGYGDVITITGKNFVQVQKVSIEGIGGVNAQELIDVVVESPERISARIPNYVFQAVRPDLTGVYKIVVTTERGIATTAPNDGLVWKWTSMMIAGRITERGQPLDSVILYIERQRPATRSVTIESSHLMRPNTFPQGWYFVSFGGEEFAPEYIIRPVKSGYRFAPANRRVLNIGATVAGQDFAAEVLAQESQPAVRSIAPDAGFSYVSDRETGTNIVVSGERLGNVEKVLIAVPYVSFGLTTTRTIGYVEARSFVVSGDNQITVTLPRLDHNRAIPGRTYENCQVILVFANSSITAPQRIRITYS